MVNKERNKEVEFFSLLCGSGGATGDGKTE